MDYLSDTTMWTCYRREISIARRGGQTNLGIPGYKKTGLQGVVFFKAFVSISRGDLARAVCRRVSYVVLLFRLLELYHDKYIPYRTWREYSIGC